MPVLAAWEDFLPGDIPLMQGLRVDNDRVTVFDTPSGRIVDIIAISNLDADAITSYYRDILPQMGWQQSNPALWRRDNEILRIDSHIRDGHTATHFFLRPDG